MSGEWYNGQNMTLTCVLSKTTTDMIKSRTLSKELSQLVLDCYMTPSEFAKIINDYYESDFTITINDTGGTDTRTKEEVS